MTTTPSVTKKALTDDTWVEIVPSLNWTGGRSTGTRTRKVAGLWIYNPNVASVTITGAISDSAGDFDTPDSTWTIFVRELEQDTNYVMPDSEYFVLAEGERFVMQLGGAAVSTVSVVVSVIDQ